MPGSVITSGDRITLRTVEQADASFIQQSYTNPKLRNPLGRKPTTIPAIKQMIEDDNRTENIQHFLICAPEEASGSPKNSQQTPIGLFTARKVRQRPNLAIWLNQEYHGAGLGKEAATRAIEMIFRTYDVPSIGAGVYEFNEPSRALLESLGFKQEGRQRKYQFYDGDYHDNLKYGLLRDEWEKQERDR